MITRTGTDCTCLGCGVVFYAKPARLRLGGGKYCTNACRYAQMRASKTCAHCGETFTLQAGVDRRQEAKYCSQACYRSAPRTPDDKRFWSKVDKAPAGCWVWRSTLANTGYGVFNVRGKVHLAHRFAYELLRRPIPKGLELDHLCSNRACVNPDHLDPVSHAENVRRGGAKKTHCVRGHPLTSDNAPNGSCLECQKVRNANRPPKRRQ